MNSDPALVTALQLLIIPIRWIKASIIPLKHYLARMNKQFQIIVRMKYTDNFARDFRQFVEGLQILLELVFQYLTAVHDDGQTLPRKKTHDLRAMQRNLLADLYQLA